MVTKGKLLYEGKAKIIYETVEGKGYLVHFKDTITAGNGEKKAEVPKKGEINNQISSLIFSYLKDKGVENHYISQLSTREMLVEKVGIIPLEVVVRNVATGSICRRLGIKEKKVFSNPLVEYYYKNDSLGDPLICENHIELLELATKSQLEGIKAIALQVNALLTELFESIGIILVDFKLEFGIGEGNRIILADEISPDTCRLWDMESGASLDKDVFRKGQGDVLQGYTEVLNRLKGRS
ncbi:phosphoribosylaminoimidazolesuccinocarboxamide synthase [Anaerobranca gottschalkii]|uniref:Phosphoribosylaminoimidazole-succinocarboxamide synthase n=1 Tax=Anaerobranca gottschalkii DSM 13577 TaxID=1120990 RepID=A0A1I0AQA2_9FIRM|nr:phosphoribosylaminoimidazolesuccinocarboxamide synthase [Anaerobranca gottschalkii]SES96357.1 phosphoribosylaminoimidazole-succinocarboxamide synthase [Anaerobranca gottschalkii DSM 13577]